MSALAALLCLIPLALLLKRADDDFSAWKANRKAIHHRLQELEQLSSQQGEAQS